MLVRGKLFEAFILHMVLSAHTNRQLWRFSWRIGGIGHPSGCSEETFSLFSNDVTSVLIYWTRTGRGLHLCVCVSVLKSPRGFFFFFRRAQLAPVTAYQGEWDRK